MKLTVAAVLVLVASPTMAQHQPYAGMKSRAIKSLSEQQVSDLKAGRGMGLALVAELNGYPGPIHVLELGAQLDLSAAQQSKMKSLYDSMKAESILLGEKLIAEEAVLDRPFCGKDDQRR